MRLRESTSAFGTVVVVVHLLAIGGCSRHPQVDTTAMFSEAEWNQWTARNSSVLQRIPDDKRHMIARQAFLKAQLAKALLLRRVTLAPVKTLPSVEQEAVRELLMLDQSANGSETPAIDVGVIQVGCAKRPDGFLNLIVDRAGTREVRSTTATWASTGP